MPCCIFSRAVLLSCYSRRYYIDIKYPQSCSTWCLLICTAAGNMVGAGSRGQSTFESRDLQMNWKEICRPSPVSLDACMSAGQQTKPQFHDFKSNTSGSILTAYFLSIALLRSHAFKHGTTDSKASRSRCISNHPSSTTKLLSLKKWPTIIKQQERGGNNYNSTRNLVHEAHLVLILCR